MAVGTNAGDEKVPPKSLGAETTNVKDGTKCQHRNGGAKKPNNKLLL